MVSFRSNLARQFPRAILTSWITFAAAAAISLSPLLLHAGGTASARRTSLDPAAEATLSHWLAHQTNIQTWAADFIQTRNLKALTEPLKSPGRVWFQAPRQFHWELGTPAQTIALRQPDTMWVIYPRLKRAERFDLSGAQTGPWKDALALFEAGFPRSLSDIQDHFEIVSSRTEGDLFLLLLKPRSSQARKLISELAIRFRPQDASLASTEITFADGSSMRNDFDHIRINPPVDEKLFSPQLPPDFKIVDPLRKQP